MCELQWLQLKETDDEKTKARKKKLQKSHKSKLRFQQLDQEVKSRQDNWQNFKKGKGAKKKVCRLLLTTSQSHALLTVLWCIDWFLVSWQEGQHVLGARGL